MAPKLLESHSDTHKSYLFYCPGCEHHHVYYTEGHQLSWKFNGDFEKPTFTPSLLMRHDGSSGMPPSCCHLYVRDGKIQYLSDCTHKFAGQTIDMIDECACTNKED